MEKSGRQPDPVEIATEIRRQLEATASERELDIAVTEALRAFRDGATRDDAVEAGKRTLRRPPTG